MSGHGTRTERSRGAAKQPRQLFTLEQANRALPLVRRIVDDIVREQATITQLESTGQRLTSNGRGEEARSVREQYLRAIDRLRELADELADIGCDLKDAQRGLVDFPALHEGRPIFLCWRHGEETVAHWHELEAGFAGRKPVGDDFNPA